MFWKKNKKESGKLLEDESKPHDSRLLKMLDEDSKYDYNNLYSQLKSDSHNLSPFEKVDKDKVEIPTASELVQELEQEELSREEELVQYLEDNSRDILDGIMKDIKRTASGEDSRGFVKYTKHFDFWNIKADIDGDGKSVYPPYKEYLSKLTVDYGADTIKYAWVEHNKEELERKGYTVTYTGNSTSYILPTLELSWRKDNE